MAKIVLKDSALSLEIADKERQALAYNMLYHMIDNGASITVNGKSVQFEKDQLWVAEQTGDVITRTKPDLDREWYSANENLFERGEHVYSTACMADDGTLVKFAPMTVSYDKANEMNNFMLFGLDPAVSISCLQDGEMKQIVNNGHPVHEGMINETGGLVTERSERDWTAGKFHGQTPLTLAVEKKYELIPDDTYRVRSAGFDSYSSSSKFFSGIYGKDITTYRIRALRDFGDVKAGDLGGYVESEDNLSHAGNCWVYDKAAVCCNAVVKDDATVRGEAEVVRAGIVSGNANVFGDAWIRDYAEVSDYAQVGFEWDGTSSPNGKRKNGDTTIVEGLSKVSGNAQVFGEVVVNGNAQITDNARVEGKWPKVPDDKHLAYYICCVGENAVIEGNAQVTNACVRSHAHIHENAVLSGHPKMGGHADISGNAEICGDARIMHNIAMNGDARIGGTAEITDKIVVGRDADIRETDDYLSLKDIGKNSYAARNRDGGVTIIHKGKSYPDIDSLKEAVGTVSQKGAAALDELDRHFGNMADDEQDFADAVANIPANDSLSKDGGLGR